VSSPSLTVRTIAPAEHLDFIRAQRSASFLQTPAWGEVKSEWRSESIGWFRDGRSAPSSTHGFRDARSSTRGEELVGVGLVLYRQLPKVKRYLAYLPEGPVIDWAADDLRAWLDNRPVAARPDSTWYHARKFVQRNWLGVSVAGGFVVSLGAALGAGGLVYLGACRVLRVHELGVLLQLLRRRRAET
jgi:vancomycin resistance protein VanK